MHVDTVMSVARQFRAQLLKRPGVLGVGHGWKVTANRRTAQYAVIVYVDHKRPPAQVPRGEVISKRVGGVPTDVVEVGTARSRHDDEREHRSLDYVKIHKQLAKTHVTPAPSTAHGQSGTGHYHPLMWEAAAVREDAISPNQSQRCDPFTTQVLHRVDTERPPLNEERW